LGRAAAITPERRLAAWFRFLLVWLFALVVAGGTVRLTGSGMSIPDWPIIYQGPNKTKGSLLPPFGESSWKTVYQTFHQEYYHIHSPGEYIPMARFKREFWTEYTHRLLAKTFGIPFLVIIIQCFRIPSVRRKVGRLLGFAIFTLAAQATLGGTVVKQHTPALLVSFHLVTAFIFVSLIVWMALKLARNPDDPLPPRPAIISSFAWLTTAVVLVQIFLGGLMAKSGAGRIAALATWPKMGDDWIPTHVLWDESLGMANLISNQVLIQVLHRWFAFVAAAFVIALIARLFLMPLSRGGRLAIRALAFVLVFQILLGILTLLNQVPLLLGLLHLTTGLVMFELLVVLVFETRTNALLAEAEKRAVQETEHGIEAEPARLS